MHKIRIEDNFNEYIVFELDRFRSDKF